MNINYVPYRGSTHDNGDPLILIFFLTIIISQTTIQTSICRKRNQIAIKWYGKRIKM
jgi:hypothetical protein